MADNIIIAPSAPPAGSPPFVGGNLCCLDRLLSGRRGYYGGWDRSLGFCEFMPVVFNQNADGTISLSGQLASAEGTEGDRAVVLPLAHGYGEAQCPSRMAPNPCTAVRDDIRAPPKLLLGACVLVVADEIGPDGQKISRVLLTRRARHMRTFAGAWVPPGGGVDPGESAAYAALRELQEEAGIVLPPAHCRPFCIWESAFPTSVAACRDAGGLKRQQLVVYYVARICGALAASARSALHFGAPTADGLGAEVDRACWLPLPHETAVSGGEDPVCDALGLVSGVSIDALAGQHGCGTTLDAGVELRGIWPNAHGRGITRGSLFALALLARTHVWQGDVARKSTD